MLRQRRYELIGIVIQIFKLIPSVVITSPLESLGMKEQWEQIVLVVTIVAAAFCSIVLAVTCVPGIDTAVVFIFVFVYLCCHHASFDNGASINLTATVYQLSLRMFP